MAKRDNPSPSVQEKPEEPDPDEALMRLPLVCDVCGSEERVLRFGKPHYVVRCQSHNPVTWRR